MSTPLLRIAISVSTLLPFAAHGAPARDLATAAWNDALHAHIDTSIQDGRTVTTIKPAVAGGATFVFRYSGASDDGLYSTATPDPASACQAGETLGACRQRVIVFVAAYWGSLLQSNVPIAATVLMPQVAADCSNRPSFMGEANAAYSTWNFPKATLIKASQ